MLDRMSARELGQWRAYEKVTGPLGLARLDYLVAHLAERITTMQSDPKKSKRNTLSDFLIPWDSKTSSSSAPDQPDLSDASPEDQKAALKAHLAKAGVKIRKAGDPKDAGRGRGGRHVRGRRTHRRSQRRPPAATPPDAAGAP